MSQATRLPNTPPKHGTSTWPKYWIDRIGAALLSPRHALAAADSDSAAGKAASDIALFLGLGFLALQTREIVASLWLAGVEDLATALRMLLSSLSAAVSTELALLCLSGLALTVLAGKKRSLGRDVDLACVAFVPFVMVKLCASAVVDIMMMATGRSVVTPVVSGVLTGAACLWTGVVLGLAWQQARSRQLADDRAKDTPASPAHLPASASPGSTDGASRQARLRSRIGGATAVAVAAFMLAVNSAWIANNAGMLRPVAKGEPAPLFRVSEVTASGTVGAAAVELADLAGGVVIIDFWATWCGPCRDALPGLEAVHRRYRDQGLSVLMINLDDPARARAMFQAMGLTMPLYIDDGNVADLYQVSTIPHTVVIDRDGAISHVHRGSFDERELSSEVERLLAE